MIPVDGTATEWGQLWEFVRGILTTLTAAGMIALLKLTVALRDGLRDVKRDISGTDGENGLKSVVRTMDARLEVLEERKIAMDAVEAAEKARYHGEERREGSRRLRDLIRQEQAELHPPHRKEPP